MTSLPLPPRPDLEVVDEEARRIELTVSCRDADQIPKVDRAGEVVDVDGVQAQVMHEGSLVLADAYYGAWMTEIIRRLQGHHEPQEELVVHHMFDRLTSDVTIVELGSFWAYYTIWGLRKLGGRAVLVEPDPANLEVTHTNLRLNGLSATVIPAAVGGSHGSTTSLICESDNIERVLPTVTVPGLMDDHDLDRIDFLLADTQGAETDMLARSLDLIREKRIRFLVVSTHHHSISGDPLTHQKCLEMLEEADCHVIAEHAVGESYSGDGLIAVSTDPTDADMEVHVTRARQRDSMFGELEPDLAVALEQNRVLSAKLDSGWIRTNARWFRRRVAR